MISKRFERVYKAEDARLQKEIGTRVRSFRCEECDISFTSIPNLLSHLDTNHGIHIWYEKGILRKRVFFDGILNKPSKEEVIVRRKENIPLSKRPYKIERKNDRSPV